MGRDLVPYRARRWQVRWERASTQGRANRFLEIPVSWYLDDFPPLAFVGGRQAGMQDRNAVFDQWRDIFDYAYERVENACYVLALHPQVIGQAHNMVLLERFVDYLASKDGTWFATCAEICDAWQDDADDVLMMEETAPAADDGHVEGILSTEPQQ
jgi:hypothetical protein